VHELLTERREEDVDLGDLVERLRATLVQGVGGGKEVVAELTEVTLSGARATALALVFSELLQNALEHGGATIRVELARRGDDVVLAIEDDGGGLADDSAAGTGLSIVRALVRDELRGTIELTSGSGTRAQVVFPA
jgi:two-component sensor histidine kinase